MKGALVYIDDEPMLCAVFGSILRKTGAAVHTFTDPEEALQFVASAEVALVFCDYRMPTLSGLQVLARIDRPIPFVLVSGDLDIEDLGETTPGVSAVLCKPFAAPTLLALVRKLALKGE